MSTEINKAQIKANGMVFDCLTCGMDNTGESVVLLHGYPSCSYMWVPVMKALAENGYRIVAPNQRGYSPGAAPYLIEAYRLPALVSDVFAIADAVGFSEKFHLAGHDWGANCGWACVELGEERLQTWTALSIPHFGAYLYTIYNDPVQYELSAYWVDRAIEGITERELVENDFAKIRQRFTLASPEQMAAILEVFSIPKCVRGAVNWYRATNPYTAYGNAQSMSFGRDIEIPVHYIQAKRDHVVSPTSVKLARKYMRGEYLHEVFDVQHRMVEEDPRGVSDSIVSFIMKYPIA